MSWTRQPCSWTEKTTTTDCESPVNLNCVRKECGYLWGDVRLCMEWTEAVNGRHRTFCTEKNMNKNVKEREETKKKKRNNTTLQLASVIPSHHARLPSPVLARPHPSSPRLTPARLPAPQLPPPHLCSSTPIPVRRTPPRRRKCYYSIVSFYCIKFVTMLQFEWTEKRCSWGLWL